MIVRTIAGVVVISSRLVYDRLVEGYLWVLEGSGGTAVAWQQMGLLQGEEGCIIVNSTNL